MRWWGRLLIATGVLATTTAAADAGPVQTGSLAVDQPAAGCPNAAKLEMGVDRLLGRPGGARAKMLEGAIGVLVRFSSTAEGHRAEVVLHGARTGRRTLVDGASDCHELGEAVALSLAILIDPSFVPPAEEQSNDAEPTPPNVSLNPQPKANAENAAAPTAPRREPPTERVGMAPLAGADRAEPRRSRRATSAALFAGGGATSRMVRPLALSAFAGAALDLSNYFGIRATALWTPATDVDVPPGTVGLELMAGALDLCAHLSRRETSPRISLCTGMSGAAIRARSSGFWRNGSATASFIAFQAGALADLSLSEGAWGVWLEAKSYLALNTDEFEVTDAGRVQPTKNPGFSVAIGPRVRFF